MPKDAFGGTYDTNVLTSGPHPSIGNHLPVFATDAEAHVQKPAAGTMTVSTETGQGHLFIYNGTAWKKVALSAV